MMHHCMALARATDCVTGEVGRLPWQRPPILACCGPWAPPLSQHTQNRRQSLRQLLRCFRLLCPASTQLSASRTLAASVRGRHHSLFSVARSKRLRVYLACPPAVRRRARPPDVRCTTPATALVDIEIPSSVDVAAIHTSPISAASPLLLRHPRLVPRSLSRRRCCYCYCFSARHAFPRHGGRCDSRPEGRCVRNLFGGSIREHCCSITWPTVDVSPTTPRQPTGHADNPAQVQAHWNLARGGIGLLHWRVVRVQEEGAAGIDGKEWEGGG